jgi:predicted RNase H-like nuclease (RuvC/YqgF family)
METAGSKVVGYIPQPLYDCLEQLKNERGLHSVSQAVNVVLEEYFGLGLQQTAMKQPLTPGVEDLKTEVANLKRQVAELRQNFNSYKKDKLTSLKSQGDLLSQKQLAERLGVQTSVIEQHKTDGKEFTDWSRSQDPEHVGWEYTQGNMFRQSGASKASLS